MWQLSRAPASDFPESPVPVARRTVEGEVVDPTTRSLGLSNRSPRRPTLDGGQAGASRRAGSVVCEHYHLAAREAQAGPSSGDPGRAGRHTGAKTVGLVTRTLTDTVTGEPYAVVDAPAAPNPAAGSLHLVPVADLTPCDLTLEEALSFVVSAGTVAPSRFDQVPTRPGGSTA